MSNSDILNKLKPEQRAYIIQNLPNIDNVRLQAIALLSKYLIRINGIYRFDKQLVAADFPCDADELMKLYEWGFSDKVQRAIQLGARNLV